ncbi:hypothetical protein HanRHA438_Chr04g0184901 [Helianthus annuus]|nr:hypothetical protein HanHA89_Chr04g0156821 [Helianthus annuus]KAJ0927616.1 hypothetical protein HanRHA438_Chr04g0184901 [Helianthus annuus]
MFDIIFSVFLILVILVGVGAVGGRVGWAFTKPTCVGRIPFNRKSINDELMMIEIPEMSPSEDSWEMVWAVRSRKMFGTTNKKSSLWPSSASWLVLL